jgi:long-chain acyl-CoA synthetase
LSTQMPWLRFYGDVPSRLPYPQITLYQALQNSAQDNPQAIAWDFFGKTSSYSRFLEEIDQVAGALTDLGLKQGDRITIAMPTCPQGIIMFYAANRIGAVASMIHPLSTEKEIEFYLNLSQSRFALTLDAFFAKFNAVRHSSCLEKLILAKIADYMPILTAVGFALTKGRKIPKVAPADWLVPWKHLFSRTFPPTPPAPMQTDDPAVILYSGGTTGRSKGILLSNQNMIAEGMMVSAWGTLTGGDSILAILPIFHGFGLGVCVNAAFMGGATSILVPQFTPESVAKLIRAKRPNILVGVPTLFDALCRNPLFQKTDLSCLKAVFCGADTLPRIIKERFDAIVQRNGGHVKLLEGYGLTEAVTAVMASPMEEYRECSIGIPFPDMQAKIVRLGGCETADCGEEGEICLCGPAVMLGYLDQPEETARTLQVHEDGKTWLHTGDIGTMDQDGFFYFKLRLKRMIKSSGMNVYPAQVENHLMRHPEVKEVCVIGVPDLAQGARVKAFVSLNDTGKACASLEAELIDYCRKDLIKWSCPREIEFRREMPKTLVGKIAYKVLEEEEIEKLRSTGGYAGETADQRTTC